MLVAHKLKQVLSLLLVAALATTSNLQKMPTKIFNPLAGKNSPGPRFRFRVRSIAHQSLYLPETMENLPQIRQLIDGVSPLVVFNCNDIKTARYSFYELRKKYDFPYWAALDYMIPDKNKTSNLVTLHLNGIQRYLAAVFMIRANAGLHGKYIISKTVPRCGLTTLVQAYILWLQLYHHSHHSITCTNTPDMMDALKTSIAGNLHRKGGRNIVFVTDTASALFQSVYDPHSLDMCQSSYVHLADMSKWIDNSEEISDHIYLNALCGWARTPASLFVLEGDYPSPTSFSNPFFLNKLMLSANPKSPSEFLHIKLP